MTPANICNSCSFFRRTACIVYDAIVVIALWMLAGLPVVLIQSGSIASGTLWFQSYLLCIAGAYFIWSWQRGGQTLGMRAWRVRLVDQHMQVPSLQQCTLRYFAALLSSFSLALGWAWALAHPQKLTWHDLISGTRLHVTLNNSASNIASHID